MFDYSLIHDKATYLVNSVDVLISLEVISEEDSLCDHVFHPKPYTGLMVRKHIINKLK